MTARIPEYLDRAFYTANSGQSGPVYLDLPEDVLTGTGRVSDSLFTKVYQPPAAGADSINQAANIFLNAKRPAIIIGKGLRWS